MRKPRNEKPVREKPEFFEQVLEINRVTRVVKGGKRMRFRALVAIGDEKTKIGWGVGKATDVSGAIAKAVADAKKNMVNITIKKSTIPHPISHTYKSAQVLLKPASPGTGIIAGGPMRVVLKLTGIKDVVGKLLGSQNKISNVIATIRALAELSDPEQVKKIRESK